MVLSIVASLSAFILVLVCYVIWAKPSKKPVTPAQQRLERQKALMHELVTACGGDKAKAIRLIEYEREKSPELKTLEAIDRAAERLCGDRGRVIRN